MFFSRHTLQARMPIHLIPSSEGKKLNLNVSRFNLYLLLNANGLLAFNLQWLQNGKGLLSHKLRPPFTMQLVSYLTWERQVESMQESKYDQMQRTSRRCPSLRRSGRPTSPILQTNLLWSLPLWHRRFLPVGSYRRLIAAPGMPDKTLLLEAGSTTVCYTPRFVIKLPSILLLSRERHQAYPVSTGHVHIQSGTDAYAPLDFHPGYLDESVIPQLPVIRPLTESLYQGG